MFLNRPRSLLWQLGLVLVSIQILLVLGFGWYLNSRITTFFNQQRLSELQGIAPWVAGALESAGGDTPGLQALLNRADLWADGLTVTVIDESGQVLADSDESPDVIVNQSGQPEVDKAFRLGSGDATRFNDTLQRDLFYYAVRRGPVGERQVVRVALPMTQLQQRLADLSGAIVIVLVVYLGVTMVLLFLASRWLSRRVFELSAGATRFAGGDLAHRVPVYPGQEFALLSEALNEMAEQLSEKMSQLRVQGSELNSILQSMSNGVIAIDLESKILSMSRVACGMFDLKGRDVRGRLLQEFIRDPALNRFVESSIADGERRFEEIKLEALDSRCMEVTSEPLHDAEDQIVGVVLVLNEVTLLRQLESIRTDFAANVSHELRTPIMAIQGYAELLQEDLEEPTRSKYLEVVIRNTTRLSAIIEDLLALARLEEPDSDERLFRETVAAREILEGVRRDCQDEALRREITLELHSPPDLRNFVNRQLIAQAITNLVINAIRYSESGTTVQMHAGEVEDGFIDLSVVDTGSGIEPEHLHRLFERFYRVDKGRSRDMGGTGLGLSIVKHIAQVHGGHVEVHSEVGVGSTFTIRLPIHQEEHFRDFAGSISGHGGLPPGE